MGRPPPCAIQKWIFLFLLMGTWAGEVDGRYHPGPSVGWGYWTLSELLLT